MRRCLYSASPPDQLTGGAVCAYEHLALLGDSFDQVCLVLCEEETPLKARAEAAGMKVWVSPIVNKGLRKAGVHTFLKGIASVVSSRFRYGFGLFQMLRCQRGLLHIHSIAVHTPYALLAGWLARVPVVVTIHEPSAQSVERLLDLWLIRIFAKRVVFLTNVMKGQYPRWLNAAVIPNAYRLPVPGIPPAHQMPVVGIIGRLGPEKGLDVFLRGFQILHERGVLCKVRAIGAWASDADAAQALTFVKANKLDGMIEFAGVCENMREVYTQIDMLIQPSRRDSYPRVIMEAMSYGVPVVATRVDGIPEMVIDGETGFLVPSEDPLALADAMLKLLETPGLRRDMGAAGRKRAEVLFSPEHYQDAMLKLYAPLEKGR